MPVIESKKRNSILGSLALLVGFSAIGLSAIDVSGLPSVNVGPWNLPFALALDLGVGALALISLLLAASSRRTGTELPLAALGVAIAAGSIYYFRHRTPPVPARTTAPTTAPAAATPLPKPVAPPNVAAKPSVNSQASARSMVPPAQSTVASAVSKGTGVAKNASQDAAAAIARQQRLAQIRDARTQFNSAQALVIQTLQNDPAYQNAKATSDAADQQLRDARLQYAPGDPNLVAFSQTALKARDALNELVAQAVAKDPAASAAKAKLDALTQSE